jgi:hypothetical protein
VVEFTTGSRGKVPGNICEKRRRGNNNNMYGLLHHHTADTERMHVKEMLYEGGIGLIKAE